MRRTTATARRLSSREVARLADETPARANSLLGPDRRTDEARRADWMRRSRAERILFTRMRLGCFRQSAPPAPAVERPAAPMSVASPRPRARAAGRTRRASTGKGATASDGPPGPQIVVSLGPVDREAVGRLARLLVEQAASEVLNRAVGAANSDAPAVSAARASEEKVV